MPRKPHFHLAGATLLLTALALSGCTYREIRPSASQQDTQTENMERFGPMRFQQIAPGIWQHTSYLDVPGFGSVPSNGLVIVDGERAILVDTAWTDDQTAALLTWAETRLGKPVTAAVVTHAHTDKMGGMGALDAAAVDSYAFEMSNRLAPEKGLRPAKHSLTFSADGTLDRPTPAALGPLLIYYPGPGHTADNITVGIAGSSAGASIAFGGCLIKGSDAASLGNLTEADLHNYPAAVERFAKAFPNAQIIVMSHSGFEDRTAIARTLKLARELN